MPELADRIRVEPRTARPPARRWRPPPPNRRTVAGAALAAMMIGIVVNAVALQHGRRLDPVPPPPAVAAIRPVQAKPAPSPSAAAAVREPPRPAPAAVALAGAPKSGDAIGDLLHGQSVERRKLTLAAQGALARLGFAVKSTGAIDPQTRSALVSFEKSRHLPVSTEITARLVQKLKAAGAAD